MVNVEKRQKIENIAIEILQNVDMLDKIPVDIIKIANSLGIKVYQCQFKEQGICGAILKEKDKFKIYVKTDDAQVRKRFTVAHELGHFLLHKEKLEDEHYDDIMFRGNLSSEEEEEANYFASCLLMNKESLIKISKFIKNKSELAKMFEVSEAAMNIRIGELI